MEDDGESEDFGDEDEDDEDYIDEDDDKEEAEEPHMTDRALRERGHVTVRGAAASASATMSAATAAAAEPTDDQEMHEIPHTHIRWMKEETERMEQLRKQYKKQGGRNIWESISKKLNAEFGNNRSASACMNKHDVSTTCNKNIGKKRATMSNEDRYGSPIRSHREHPYGSNGRPSGRCDEDTEEKGRVQISCKMIMSAHSR